MSEVVSRVVLGLNAVIKEPLDEIIKPLSVPFFLFTWEVMFRLHDWLSYLIHLFMVLYLLILLDTRPLVAKVVG